MKQSEGGWESNLVDVHFTADQSGYPQSYIPACISFHLLMECFSLAIMFHFTPVDIHSQHITYVCLYFHTCTNIFYVSGVFTMLFLVHKLLTVTVDIHSHACIYVSICISVQVRTFVLLFTNC